MNPSSKRRSVAAGILLVLALAVGGAYAYWTNSGTGSGSASTSNPPANELVVTGIGTGHALTAMYPGDSAQTIWVDIQNNGAAAVHVTTVDVTSVDGAPSFNGTCSAGDYTVSGSSTIPTAVDIDPGDTATVQTNKTIQFNNKPLDNQNDCKGQALTLNFSAG